MSDSESEDSNDGMEMEDVINKLKLQLREKDWEMGELQKEQEAKEVEMKKKYKEVELKKREADLAVNKVKTEIVSLRSQDKLWKQSSRNIAIAMQNTKATFDTQVDQVMAGLKGITKAGHRMKLKIPYLEALKDNIANLQSIIKTQESQINTLNNKIRVITAELEDKTLKVEKLSKGLEAEVDRLCKPMRNRISEVMNTLMREKAARAQERRNLAELWPENTIMPTLLMKYRNLTDEEKVTRKRKCLEEQASLALTLEIRANFSEKAQWKKEYDDYGREFYQHAKTGQTLWEPPEILEYTAPPGRDEQGNISVSANAEAAKWVMKNDYKGGIYFQNEVTKEITFTSPFAYTDIPKGRSEEEIIGEASRTVLLFLKGKIRKHIKRMRKMKKAVENPLTYQEKMKIEKEKNENLFGSSAVKKEGDGGDDSDEEEEEEIDGGGGGGAHAEDLSKYQYDIETIEYLADMYGPRDESLPKKDPEHPENFSVAARAFLADSDARVIDAEYYAGITTADLDVEEATLEQFRDIVQSYAITEERLDRRLTRIRDNMSDFSQLLLQRVEEQRVAEAARVREAGILATGERMMSEKRAETRVRLKEEKREARRREKEDKARLEEEMAVLVSQSAGGEAELPAVAVDGDGGGDVAVGDRDGDPDGVDELEQNPQAAVSGELIGADAKSGTVTPADGTKTERNAAAGQDDDDLSSLGDNSHVDGAGAGTDKPRENGSESGSKAEKGSKPDDDGSRVILYDDDGNPYYAPTEADVSESEEVESDVSSIRSDITISTIDEHEIIDMYDQEQLGDDGASLRSAITYGVATMDVNSIIDNAIALSENRYVPVKNPVDMVLSLPVHGDTALGTTDLDSRPNTSTPGFPIGSRPISAGPPRTPATPGNVWENRPLTKQGGATTDDQFNRRYPKRKTEMARQMLAAREARLSNVSGMDGGEGVDDDGGGQADILYIDEDVSMGADDEGEQDHGEFARYDDDGAEVYARRQSVGDMSLTSMASQVVYTSDEIMDTSDNLACLCLYSGFTNLRMDLCPDDYNLRYSYMSPGAGGGAPNCGLGSSGICNSNGHEGGPGPIPSEYMVTTTDDTWLTCSFFITINKQRIDGITEASRSVGVNSHSAIGALPFGIRSDTFDTLGLQPLHSCRLVAEANMLQKKNAMDQDKQEIKHDSRTADEVARDIARREQEGRAAAGPQGGDDTSVRTINKNVSSLNAALHPHPPQVALVNERIVTQHANWKYRQLVMEVLRYQFADEALGDAYTGVILQNCSDDPMNRNGNGDGGMSHYEDGYRPDAQHYHPMTGAQMNANGRRMNHAILKTGHIQFKASESGPNGSHSDNDSHGDTIGTFDPDNLAHSHNGKPYERRILLPSEMMNGSLNGDDDGAGGHGSNKSSSSDGDNHGHQGGLLHSPISKAPIVRDYVSAADGKFQQTATPIGNRRGIHLKANVQFDTAQQQQSPDDDNGSGIDHGDVLFDRGNTPHTPYTGNSRGPVPMCLAPNGATEMNFVQMVNEFRGDYNPSCGHTNTGKVVRDRFSSQKGVNDSASQCFHDMFMGNMTVEEVKQLTFKTPLKKLVKSLPNFKKMKYFLDQKSRFHLRYVNIALAEIISIYDEVDIKAEEKREQSKEALRSGKNRYQYFYDSGASMRAELIRIADKLNVDRVSLPEIKAPEFAELEEVKYTPNFPPPSAGVDSKGKKKKSLPSQLFKNILGQCETGALDGVDKWPFEDFYPSPAQLKKLEEASKSRNAKLDNQRLQETMLREKAEESYQEDVIKRDYAENKRIQEYHKTKKESRKINLKLQCFTERCDRMKQVVGALEADYKSSEGLFELHVESKKRFQVMRAKQYLERVRQIGYIKALKDKLYKLLDSRRRALEFPKGATNMVEFEELREQSEQAIRTLRYEIFEVKENLVAEGVRLRNMQEEEYKCYLMELNRVRILRDVTYQRQCLNKIIARHKYEVLHVMEDLEKLKLIEADKDDMGEEGTVDDIGEVYLPDKVWDTPDIASCQRTYDVIMEKINMSEGLGNTAGSVQLAVLEVMSTKWNCECGPVRDSWVENSDYERSQQLYSDVLLWLNNQIVRLDRREHYLDIKNLDHKRHADAYKEQIEMNLDTHGKEISCVTQSNMDVVHTMTERLDILRRDFVENQTRLEKNVTEISRECQKVREEAVAAQIAYDEKMKVLWSFVATLQASLQQITSKLTLVEEDRDKIVITTKLAADKLRHQLRVERQHAATLMFIIYWQKGSIQSLRNTLQHFNDAHLMNELAHHNHKNKLRKDLWEQVFCFTRLCTDVNALFEFFVSRLANLAGSRSFINEQLHHNGAAMILAACCKSPRPNIRKLAARALAGMGWDSYVETRILIWDCMMQWKLYKKQVIEAETEEFNVTLEEYQRTEKDDAIISYRSIVDKRRKLDKERRQAEHEATGNPIAPPADGHEEEEADDEFVVPNQANMTLRQLIKQRRQWALRATRRKEGPNVMNQKLLNIQDGVIPALLTLCECDGSVDWEIVRNAALALSVASYEQMNHYHMANDIHCVQVLLKLCANDDVEIRTHAGIAVANLCHKNESAQTIFGNAGAIPVLLAMLSSTIVVDVLEAATAALANLTCFSDANCARVLEANGVEIMVSILTASLTENLLDIDQNDEVQANAAEMLANVSRFDCPMTVTMFNGKVIDTLVMMCASKNKQVRRHAPLVLGNVSQNAPCRVEIGDRGGIESLFLALEDNDSTTLANVLWALSNLMWHPPNQERAGRFMLDIVKFMQSEWMAVKVHACMLIANMLYYNDGNRSRFLEIVGGMELLISYITEREEPSVVEGSLRAMLSLSYLDYVSTYLGNGFNAHGVDTENPANHTDMSKSCIPIFIGFLIPSYYTRDSMKYSLEIICNLCVHHNNRKLILNHGGIEALVSLQNDQDVYIQNLSVQIIEHLEDVTPPEVLARMKVDIGIDRMVQLITDSDPLVRAVAAETVGEEIYKNPRMAQKHIVKLGGVDALLSLIAGKNEPIESLIPGLWSLRNLLTDCPEAKGQFEYREGIEVILSVVPRCYAGDFKQQVDKVLEATLTLLQVAIKDHDRNSRRLLLVGLETIMDIADGGAIKNMGLLVPKESTPGYGKRTREDTREAWEKEAEREKKEDSRAVVKALRGGVVGTQTNMTSGLIAVAKTILQSLGPYNYIVCRQCHKRQNLSGTNCLQCGNKLLI